MIERTRLLIGTTLWVVAVAAHAQASSWGLRIGPGHSNFATMTILTVAGAPAPGAALKASSDTFLGVEISRMLAEDWSVRLVLGVPPITGTLGKVTYGPPVLSVTRPLSSLPASSPTWALA